MEILTTIVEYDIDPSFETSDREAIGGAQTTMQLYNLAPNTTYYVRAIVRAEDRNYYYSQIEQFTTLP